MHPSFNFFIELNACLIYYLLQIIFSWILSPLRKLCWTVSLDKLGMTKYSFKSFYLKLVQNFIMRTKSFLILTHTPSTVRDSFLLCNYHFQCLSIFYTKQFFGLYSAVIWPACSSEHPLCLWTHKTTIFSDKGRGDRETGILGTCAFTHTHQATENTCIEDCFIWTNCRRQKNTI